jgi:hypothetical protein
MLKAYGDKECINMGGKCAKFYYILIRYFRYAGTGL